MKSYCVKEKRETECVPGTEQMRTASNGRLMMVCKCASCGIMKTQFLSGSAGQRGGAVGKRDFACGIDLRGKRPGTVKECFDSGQIRRYGQKIAEDLDLLLIDRKADRQRKQTASRLTSAKDSLRYQLDNFLKKNLKNVGDSVKLPDAIIIRVARNKYDLNTDDQSFENLSKSKLLDYLIRAYGEQIRAVALQRNQTGGARVKGDYTCGLDPKKKPFSPEKCLEMKQIRYWGKEKVPPEVLEMGSSTDMAKRRQNLIAQRIKLVSEIKKLRDEQKYFFNRRTPEQMNEISKKGNKLVKQLKALTPKIEKVEAELKKVEKEAELEEYRQRLAKSVLINTNRPRPKRKPKSTMYVPKKKTIYDFDDDDEDFEDLGDW